jgi:hypothetical protein
LGLLLTLGTGNVFSSIAAASDCGAFGCKIASQIDDRLRRD